MSASLPAVRLLSQSSYNKFHSTLYCCKPRHLLLRLLALAHAACRSLAYSRTPFRKLAWICTLHRMGSCPLHMSAASLKWCLRPAAAVPWVRPVMLGCMRSSSASLEHQAQRALKLRDITSYCHLLGKGSIHHVQLTSGMHSVQLPHAAHCQYHDATCWT